MATLRQLRRTDNPPTIARGYDDVVQWQSIANGGGFFPYGFGGRPLTRNAEAPTDDLVSLVHNVYRRNGIVYACMAVRAAVFAEVRFRYANLDQGRIGRLFGGPSLDILGAPWPNGTTGELAARMIQDVDLTGNSYWVRDGNRLWRRSPDKMVIILNGDPNEDEYANVAGYGYYPDGIRPGARHFLYLPEQVAHWSPYPDPLADYRGMSWITPVLREIAADSAAQDHKLDFFRNGATPNMIVKTPAEVMTSEQFERFKTKLDSEHAAAGKRYKTLYLAPGADVQVVGRDFQQMDFSETQGRDETRIASASGVPAVIVGLKESMSGSSLNAGNYGQARRRFADGTMRPLFRSAAAALQTIVPPPGTGTVLWYDDSQVAFFREDRADAADIFYKKSLTVESLVRAGYEPDTVADAVENEDLKALVHTGLFSVQLQPAGTDQNGTSGGS
jgi:phage portal protein BeeE